MNRCSVSAYCIAEALSVVAGFAFGNGAWGGGLFIVLVVTGFLKVGYDFDRAEWC